jgi:mannose-6-phosphate isomerase-like protein (cupin superfamily)
MRISAVLCLSVGALAAFRVLSQPPQAPQSAIARTTPSGTPAAPPASYATASELIASVGASSEPVGTSGSTNLSKARQVARAGDDRVSVDVLKRTKPEEGPVLHDKVTEVYEILQGGGTLETGGVLIGAKPFLAANGKPVNPESIGPSRVGTDMSGGQVRHVNVGDIVLIPPGTPHRFTQLDGSIVYAVIRFNPGWYGTRGKAP